MLGRGVSKSYIFSLVGEPIDGRPIEITFDADHLGSMIRENRNKSIGVRLGFIYDKIVNRVPDSWEDYCAKNGFDLPKEKKIFHLVARVGLLNWFRADFDEEELESLIKSSSHHKYTSSMYKGLCFLRDSVMQKTSETWEEYSKRIGDEFSLKTDDCDAVPVDSFDGRGGVSF